MNSTLRNKIYPRRLQVQVGFIVSLLMIATLGLYAWRTTQAQAENLTHALKEQTFIMAKNIADLSVNYLLIQDFDSIEALLIKTAKYPDVLAITVTDRQGTVFSQVVRQPGAKARVNYGAASMSPPVDERPSTVIREDRIVVWYPMGGWSVLGWVETEYSLQVISDLHRRIWRESLIDAVVVIALSTFLLLLFLNRHIGAVKKITTFAKRLKEQRGETIPVVRSSIEIEQLMTALNDASLRLSEQTRSIKESEEKYRSLFEESKDVIIIDTPGDGIIDINPAGVALFGYSSLEELLAADIAKDLYVNPQDREIVKQIVARQGFIQDHEVKFKRKNGDILNVLITATPVYGEGGSITAYRGILRDVTSEKMLKDQLFHAQKMEAVGQLTGGIAHDFNNILGALASYVYLLQKKMKAGDPLLLYVNQILTTVERATNLTRSLLAFSRKQISNPEPVSLNVIVRKVEQLLSQVSGENIELVTALSDEDVTVVADSGQMEQVLMNLATNARDAMPTGGRLTIATRSVELGDELLKVHGYGKPGRHILLSVTDEGMGMDDQTMKKIFEPFFTTKTVGKGTGLGLAIVYGIIKQNNGYITVSSKPGKGTTFKIYLPVAASMSNASLSAE